MSNRQAKLIGRMANAEALGEAAAIKDTTPGAFFLGALIAAENCGYRRDNRPCRAMFIFGYFNKLHEIAPRGVVTDKYNVVIGLGVDYD
jgi:hypothetical protein